MESNAFGLGDRQGDQSNSALHARLVDFAQNVTFDRLPTDVVESAKIFILDTLSVGVAGCCHPASTGALTVADNWGGVGACRVLGRQGVRLPSTSAAFVNGFQIHCLEWDALHEPSVVIACCVTVAALLAEIERATVSGREFIEAFVTGVEIAVFFGSAAAGAPRFFRPSAAGIMGATLACAKLRGLSRGQMLDALGLAYCQLSGTMQAHWEGSTALALQVGFAARGAVTAVDLAQAGLSGPHAVVDGPFGYFSLIEQPENLEASAARMGSPWAITEVAHKPYPAGRATQATLTALADMRVEMPFDHSDVVRLVVEAPSLILLLVGRPLLASMTSSYARLCLKFVAPMMLIDGDVDPRKFVPERFTDPAIAALARRIELVLDDNPDPNAMSPQTITLELKGGRQLVRRIESPLGSPGNPLSPQQCHAKATKCFAVGAPGHHVSSLIETVNQLAQADDARVVFEAIDAPV